VKTVTAMAQLEMNQRLSRALRLGFALLLLAAGSASATQATDGLLLRLLNERLVLMEQVAAYKWQHDLPIEDKAREDQVVAGSVDKALRVGMEPQLAVVFFRAQIAAAKEVQAYWFARWRASTGRWV